MNENMVDQKRRGIHVWIPQRAEQLKIGPVRWDGRNMITDFCIDDDRVIEIGIIERCVLDRIDGRSSPEQICNALRKQGVNLTYQRTVTILNKLAFAGALQRSPSVAKDTERSGHTYAPRGSTTSRNRFAHAMTALCKCLSWLGQPSGFYLLCTFGGVSLVALTDFFYTVPRNVFSENTTGVVSGIVTTCLWSGLTAFFHECGHAAVFYSKSRRLPLFGMSIYGPNTRLPGFSLLNFPEKAWVLLAGPLVSLTLTAIPALITMTAPSAYVRSSAAICTTANMVFIAIGLSTLPNTDVTKLLEAWASVDNLATVSRLTYQGRSVMPHHLPWRTKCVIRVYPFLLLITIIVWCVAIACAIRLMLR